MRINSSDGDFHQMNRLHNSKAWYACQSIVHGFFSKQNIAHRDAWTLDVVNPIAKEAAASLLHVWTIGEHLNAKTLSKTKQQHFDYTHNDICSAHLHGINNVIDSLWGRVVYRDAVLRHGPILHLDKQSLFE